MTASFSTLSFVITKMQQNIIQIRKPNIFWIVLNICNVILYISAGLVFMPIVAVCYLALNVIGIIHWKKEWKKQENYVENN